MIQGNITFGNGGGSGGGLPISGARSGNSIESLFVVLGQVVGTAGNPAALLGIREIPYADGQYISLQNTNVADARITMGVFPGNNSTVGINIEGNEPTKTPIIVMRDKGATSPTNGQWSLQVQNDSWSVNDTIGFFFRCTRSASLVQLSARNNASLFMRGAIYGYSPILDSNANLAIVLTAQGQQSRTVCTNRGAAAAITFTLPAFTVVGVDYTFTVVAAFQLLIQAPGGVTIRIGAVVSAAGGTVSANAVGSSVRIVNISSTEWQAVAAVGAWVTP